MELAKRVKAILITPQTEWLVIEREPGDTGYLFTNYVAKLAAIPAVCGFIGGSIVGTTLPIVGTYHVGILAGLVAAIVRYILAFVTVYVVALITDALAPTFDAQKDQESALKLAVYSMTPAWLAGVFSLIPGLRALGILGLYGFYLFWIGIEPLMRAPKAKALVYTAAVVVCAIVISILASAVLGIFGSI